MVAWRGPLTADQTGHPVVWHSTLDALGYGGLVAMPELDAQWFRSFWGDDGTTKRLHTWGHRDKVGDKPVKTSPHFLCTRGGTGFHTDPAYTRYALQIQLYNQGFVVQGVEDDTNAMPLFAPGLVILLDTWSPHAVLRDPRLPQLGINKVLVGSDFVSMPDVSAEVPKLVEHIPLLQLP
jgi:hypothetical protein